MHSYTAANMYTAIEMFLYLAILSERKEATLWACSHVTHTLRFFRLYCFCRKYKVYYSVNKMDANLTDLNHTLRKNPQKNSFAEYAWKLTCTADIKSAKYQNLHCRRSKDFLLFSPLTLTVLLKST